MLHSPHTTTRPRALIAPALAIALALTLAACGDASDDAGSSCAEGEVFNAITQTCEAQSGAALTPGAQGAFACVVTTPGAPSIDNTSTIKGAYNGKPVSFEGSPTCSLYNAVDGTELLDIFLAGATLGDDGEAVALGLSLTMRRADVGETSNFPVTALPYLAAEYEPNRITATLFQTRFDADGNVVLSDIRAIARVQTGALNFGATSDPNATLTGTVELEGFETFDADSAIGDSCTTNEDCAIPQGQFCETSAPEQAPASICLATCETNDDCAPAGGVCVVLTDYSICMPPCAEDFSCAEGLGCYDVEESPTGVCYFVS